MTALCLCYDPVVRGASAQIEVQARPYAKGKSTGFI